MFYIVNGDTPAIKMVNLDGTNKQIVLTKKIVELSDITLDRPAMRIYFADRRLDYIDYCDYDGGNRHQLIVGHHVS